MLFFSQQRTVRKSLFKKKSNYGFEANHQKLSLRSGEGDVGGNCFSMLFDFVSHVPKRLPPGPPRAPGGDQMLAVAQRKPKPLMPGMSPSLMSTQEAGETGQPAFSQE